MSGFGTATAAVSGGGFTTTAVSSTETWNGSSWTEVNNMNTGRYAVASFGITTAALFTGGNDGPPTPDDTGATEIFNGTNSRSVDLSAYEGQDIYIAWVLTQTWGDGWLIYNLTLENQNASIPSPATTPNPADEATVNLTNDRDMNNDGSITAADQHYLFTWSPGVTGDAPTAYDYYFGTDSSTLSLLGDTTANDGFRLYGLSTGTTYFWQVVPKNAGGSAVAASCPIWSFTTSSNVLSFNDNQLNSIVVSPNPVKDVVTINNLSGLDSVEVFNQLGQLVLLSLIHI